MELSFCCVFSAVRKEGLMYVLIWICFSPFFLLGDHSFFFQFFQIVKGEFYGSMLEFVSFVFFNTSVAKRRNLGCYLNLWFAKEKWVF